MWKERGQNTLRSEDALTQTHEMMTVEDAAEYLQVSPNTLYRWLKLGGKVWRVPRRELDRWVCARARRNLIESAPRVTAEWLEGVRGLREAILEDMGGEPFRGDEIEEMIREGRR